MAFLKTALEMARTAVYSLHKSSTRDVSSNHHDIVNLKFMTVFLNICCEYRLPKYVFLLTFLNIWRLETDFSL